MSSASALLFIMVATVRNMLKRQLRRVREPRYLLATLFGLFYVGNVIFQPGMGVRRAARQVAVSGVGDSLRGDAMAWMGMLFILFGWLFGGDESGVAFTEAEIQFLFPAPLTRRQLIHYKLLRSLALSLFSALILSIGFGRRLGSGPLVVLGAWLGVATLSLHLVAASLTRLSLLDHGVRGPARRALALVIPAAILGAIVGGFVLVPDAWPQRWAEVKPYLAHLFATPPLTWAALPLAPAVRVAMARAPGDLWPWLPAAAGVLGLHYLWALSTGAAFEQASIASAERRARRVEGMRRGQLTIRAGARPPFTLAPLGAPAVAIYWKNLTAAVRVLSLRMLLIILLPAFFGGVGAVAGGGAPLNRELGAIVCGILTVSTALFGAQVYRIDFRLDLAVIDVLKSYPLRGVDLALAEVLAPFTVLTLAEWLFLSGAAILAPPGLVASFGRIPLAVTAMVIFPALTLPGLLVQNAAALLFPAWVESGTAPPRGVEAIGQRMLTLVGTLLAVAVALVPAAIVGGVVGALLYQVVGSAALPLGALAGAAVVAGEAAAAFFGLGRAFERFDPGRQ